jgi:hypothetical protein
MSIANSHTSRHVRALRSLANMTACEAAKHVLMPSVVRSFCYLAALPPNTDGWLLHADQFCETSDEILEAIAVEDAN